MCYGGGGNGGSTNGGARARGKGKEEGKHAGRENDSGCSSRGRGAQGRAKGGRLGGAAAGKQDAAQSMNCHQKSTCVYQQTKGSGETGCIASTALGTSVQQLGNIAAQNWGSGYTRLSSVMLEDRLMNRIQGAYIRSRTRVHISAAEHKQVGGRP